MNTEIETDTLREHIDYKARWLEYIIEHRKDRNCPYRPTRRAVDKHKSVLATLRKLLQQKEAGENT